MKRTYILNFIGKDKIGIVAKITKELAICDCNIADANMARLSGNFCIMMMVETSLTKEKLITILQPVITDFNLFLHLDKITIKQKNYTPANVHLSVYGADRAGIIAEVTDVLATLNFNILDLYSQCAGNRSNPIYIINIEGISVCDVDHLQDEIKSKLKNNIEFNLTKLENEVY
jgi:glycine cleavage system transcriptional repressor